MAFIRPDRILIILFCFAILGWVVLLITNEQGVSRELVEEVELDVIQAGHSVSNLLHRRNHVEEETESSDGTGREDALVPVQKVPTPPEMSEIMANMTTFVKRMSKKFQGITQNQKNPTDIWNIYYELAEEILIPLDLKYRGHTIYPVRDDDSIFVSIGSYRDELCPPTLKSMYEKAANPEKVYTGLVMQNCLDHCRTGVLDKQGTIKDMGPDIDCYKDFCESDVGREHCDAGRVRLFFINETESLGPAQARYFAAKLWQGENWFFQIDSHCVFAQDWDTELILEYSQCPTENPKRVLTHYPPSPDMRGWQDKVGMRMCDPLFATSDIESQIVRLGAGMFFDKEKIGPRYAPFIAAGFFFTHSSFLAEVPFDPLMPWIFMGEEILLSLRAWTNGWDIFSPNKNTVTHYYVRRHKPKFWETVGRVFKQPGIHNPIQLKVMDRVKNIIGYPETHDDIVYPPSLLAHKDLYGIGNVRQSQDFMDMVGIDVQTKRIVIPQWCHKGVPPPLDE
eukprot:CAMPEP_0117744186 /NCGR_PEP_ID=MMETSP0947-20121206/6602_1 /TAXON_ID=44440 /ORGANISM="Chattonella subsalsa, Strain CCMP2191" /LENGTH=507 /DNA_ID=CAMNT_0005561073 /DNA_START=162 /DNA_END=1685 /DNA_ORIENTATION=-